MFILANFIYRINNQFSTILTKKAKNQQERRMVILFRGDKQIPDIEEIIVGPLPNPTGYRKVPY